MKDEFKGITPEKFKKYKKGQLGSWQKFNTKTDAGNVELNTKMFNNASTPMSSPNTAPVGGGMGESLEGEEYGQYNKLVNAIKKADDRELCKSLEIDASIPYGPSFVLQDGAIAYLEEGEYSDSEIIHEELIEGMVRDIADSLGIDIDKVMLDYAWSDLVDVVFTNLMEERGWVRLNTGTSQIEDRYYMVLPKKRPTNAQFEVIERFIEDGDYEEKPEVIVYIEDNKYHPTSKVYSYDDYLPEDIVKNLKRYYASGTLYETIEPQEQLLDQEDIETLYEWVLDIISYEAQGQGEVGDGRYIINVTKDKHYGLVFEIVDAVNGKTIGRETTGVKLSEDKLESIADRITHHIVDRITASDSSLIGESTLKQIKEKCMKSIDNHIDDVLILEKVGGYDAIACEFDKKKNSLRVYSIENPTIDLYRGKLK